MAVWASWSRIQTLCHPPPLPPPTPKPHRRIMEVEIPQTALVLDSAALGRGTVESMKHLHHAPLHSDTAGRAQPNPASTIKYSRHLHHYPSSLNGNGKTGANLTPYSTAWIRLNGANYGSCHLKRPTEGSAVMPEDIMGCLYSERCRVDLTAHKTVSSGSSHTQHETDKEPCTLFLVNMSQ